MNCCKEHQFTLRSVIITHPDLAVHAWKLSLDYVILVPRPSVYFGQRGSGNKNGIM